MAHRILVSLFHDVHGGRAFARAFARIGRGWEKGCMLHLRSPVEGLAGVWDAGHWDGAVVQIIDKSSHDAAASAPCPVVLFDPRQEVLPHLDRVLFDHAEIGSLAARHLLETGRRCFAVLGFEGAKISDLRTATFVGAVKRAGYECPVLRVRIDISHPRTRVADETRPEIERFAREIPKPAAIFCCNDELARVLLESCLAQGISVPTELAILGADDDDLLCLTCTPTISSVRVPYDIAGVKVAELFEKRIAGQEAVRHVVVAPVEVMMRDSTRVVPGEDRIVEEAMRVIHLGFSGELRMNKLAERVGLSLSALERRFKTALGKTPLQELQRLRLHEARRLLAESDLPIRTVVRQSGFQSATRFCIAFREETGVSPTEYRRSRRGR